MSEQNTARKPLRGPQQLRGSRIVSVGSYLPERVVKVEDVAGDYGVEPAWVMKRTGVAQRHFARDDETVSEMATNAAEIALERAGMSAEEIDLIILGTSSAEYQTPGSAPIIADRLGAVNAGAIDLGAACAGWLSGVSFAASQIETGRSENVLVLGAEIISPHFAPEDVSVALLMADGAGATVMRPADLGQTGVGPTIHRADGSYAEMVKAPRVDPKYGKAIFYMQGQETFTFAVRAMVDITRETLEQAGLDFGDIDLFVYHQANGRILRAVGDRLQLPPDRAVSIVERTGNTSAASIPLALDDCYENGRLEPGTRIFMASIGAGFVWSSAIIDWDPPAS